MRGIIGRKVGMTTFFVESGEAFPVTIIEAGPCPVVQIKTVEKEGYNAYQIGYEEIKPKFKTVKRGNKKVKKHVRPVKPMEGHFKRAGVKPLRHLVEFRTDDTSKYKVGDEIKKDDIVAIVEAMKMNTEISSPVDGKVKKINFKSGDNVREGELIVEFEEEVLNCTSKGFQSKNDDVADCISMLSFLDAIIPSKVVMSGSDNDPLTIKKKMNAIFLPQTGMKKKSTYIC